MISFTAERELHLLGSPVYKIFKTRKKLSLESSLHAFVLNGGCLLQIIFTLLATCLIFLATGVHFFLVSYTLLPAFSLEKVDRWGILSVAVGKKKKKDWPCNLDFSPTTYWQTNWLDKKCVNCLIRTGLAVMKILSRHSYHLF